MKKIVLVIVIALSFLNAWENGYVVRVIDGDTLIVRDNTFNQYKVRLIGVDTFETKINDRAYYQLNTLKTIHYKSNKNINDVLNLGHKASKYVTNKFLHKYIEFAKFGRDKYDRELVYISGLNYMLVRLGLALYYPNNHLQEVRKKFLLDASREANLEKRGIYYGK